MMNRHVDPSFLLLLEGRLGAEEKRRVEAHLAGCPRCHGRFENLRRNHALLSDQPDAHLPEDRARQIRAVLRERRLQQASQPVGGLSPWSLRLAWMAPAVAILALAIGITVTSRLEAFPEWPQWRGPLRDGKSLEKGLLKQWPEGGPPLAWQTEGLGRGYASVSVSGGRIFTMGDLDDEFGGGQYVIALGHEAGRHLWKTRIGPMWDDEYMGPRATPTIDGRRIYAMSTGGMVFCLEVATGKVLWRRSLPGEYGGAMMRRAGANDWKFTESPLVDGDRVIVTPGIQRAALVAFNKRTGEEIWHAVIPDLGEQGSDGAGYASAVISEAGGLRHYVQFIGRGLIGIEAETGRFLWGYNQVANSTANIQTPIVSGNYIFAANGYKTGAVLLEIVSRGDGLEAREVYTLDSDILENHHGGLILHDGYIYTGTGQGVGRPVCVELATGEVTWGPARNAGRRSAAVAYADGRLYFRYQDGRVILIEATPEGYREHGLFRIPGPRKESWPLPVIVGGKLYLREQDRLLTYDLRTTDS